MLWWNEGKEDLAIPDTIFHWVVNISLHILDIYPYFDFLDLILSSLIFYFFKFFCGASHKFRVLPTIANENIRFMAFLLFNFTFLHFQFTSKVFFFFEDKWLFVCLGNKGVQIIFIFKVFHKHLSSHMALSHQRSNFFRQIQLTQYPIAHIHFIPFIKVLLGELLQSLILARF